MVCEMSGVSYCFYLVPAGKQIIWTWIGRENI